MSEHIEAHLLVQIRHKVKDQNELSVRPVKETERFDFMAGTQVNLQNSFKDLLQIILRIGKNSIIQILELVHTSKLHLDCELNS